MKYKPLEKQIEEAKKAGDLQWYCILRDWQKKQCEGIDSGNKFHPEKPDKIIFEFPIRHWKKEIEGEWVSDKDSEYEKYSQAQDAHEVNQDEE